MTKQSIEFQTLLNIHEVYVYISKMLPPSMGCDGGQVVNILTLYSDYLSSTPTEVYNFYSNF